MRKIRKGFTLVELLIVIAILGSFSAMMATSSSDSIDASAAAAIINNLQTMKAAAFQMYQDRPDIASLPAIAGDTDIDGDESGTDTVAKVLGGLLGREDIATNYGIVGTGDKWFVYYNITDKDSAKVKAKLLASANAVGLYAQAVSGENATATVAAFTGYYNDSASQNCVGLRVR